jgi:AI-2 transport protein TqsA
MRTTLRDELTCVAVGCLMVLAVVAIAAALIYTRAVMIPFVLAVFIVTVVSPVVDFQVVRLRFPRSIAIGVALLLVLAVLGVLGMLLFAGIETMIANAEVFRETLGSMTGRVVAQLGEWNVRLDHGKIVQEIEGLLPAMAKGTFDKATGLLSTGFLITVFVVFLLAGRKSPAPQVGIYAEIESQSRRYIATKLVISAVTGLLVGLILWSFGLPMASLFGTLAFVLNFIPSIGSVIATLLPIPIALAHFGGNAWVTLAVVAYPGAVHMTVGNVIEPKLMGHGMKLHPVTVLFSLAFWGLLWGPLGMVLAVPITAVVRIILMRFATTRPIGELLGGQLPGTVPPAPQSGQQDATKVQESSHG